MGRFNTRVDLERGNISYHKKKKKKIIRKEENQQNNEHFLYKNEKNRKIDIKNQISQRKYIKNCQKKR